MAIQIEEYKNMNTASKTYGQYYGRAVDNTPMTLDELVDHIGFHHIFTPTDCYLLVRWANCNM